MDTSHQSLKQAAFLTDQAEAQHLACTLLRKITVAALGESGGSKDACRLMTEGLCIDAALFCQHNRN